MAEFYEALTPEKLAQVYILVSQEALLLDRAQDAIRDAAVPEDLRGFNVDHLAGKGGSADQIASISQTLPMMAKRRLVVVRGLDLLPPAELLDEQTLGSPERLARSGLHVDPLLNVFVQPLAQLTCPRPWYHCLY